MKFNFTLLVLLTSVSASYAQNVGINTDGSNPTMMLDVKPLSTATSDGIRINNPNAGDGDAILNFQNNGTDVWTIGFDDSDADALKIANGLALTTKTRLNIETDGKVGVNTVAPTSRLHVVEATDAVVGVRIVKDNTEDALQMDISNTLGGLGNAVDIDFVSNTNSSSAVWLKNYGDFAGYNVDNFGDAYGVQVWQHSTTTTNPAVNIYNQSTAVEALAVTSDDFLGVDVVITNAGDGINTLTTSGQGGYLASLNGEGIWAYGDGGDNEGIYSYGNTGEGVVAECGDVINDYAIYGFGDTGASGTKFFVIDHPLDPENKELRHFAIESDEPVLIYRGMEEFDADGKVTVALKDYVKAININYTYNLTPVGKYMPIFIEEEVNENGVFVIAGGEPGASVSWTLYGQRHDAYLQKYPEKLNVEIDKPADKVGKYIDPRAHNQPMSSGYNADKYAKFEELNQKASQKVKATQETEAGTNK